MFRFNGFTQKANAAINIGITQAGYLGHTYVGSEHLLLGLIKEGSGVAYNALCQKQVGYEDVNAMLIKNIGRGIESNLTPSDFTPRCKRILESAILEARGFGHTYVGTEHILMAILKEPDSYAVRFLREFGVDTDQLYRTLAETIGVDTGDFFSSDKGKKGSSRPARATATRTATLDRFSRDLTDLARLGRLDPVVGRDKEIERVIQILSRRTKNNPCLVGEAGVGKTAIVEGLAQMIADGNVPDTLRNRRLVSLDLSGIVAGTKYRGDFEERIKNTIEEVVGAGNVVLFIDEMHTLIGTGAAEGAIDAANILKPQLARGELQVIGATTIDEYRKFIEKDAALDRRFQSIMIEEPGEEDAVTILNGLRERYESHHKIKITDEAIESAVSLSVRYIPDRFLPDKAIDLIDEAASKVRIKSTASSESQLELEERLQALKREKEAAINAQDFELAAHIRDGERELRGELEAEQAQWCSIPRESSCVTAQDIAQVVSDSTGIAITSITEEEGERLLKLESLIHEKIIGQGQAVGAVARAIRRSRVGLKDPNRPIGSFVFLGPTGVGKTQLCRALAYSLFGSEQALIRLDMSEYMDKYSTSKLIGSPPGYVGYEEGGQLTEKLRRKPYSVVLLDEIEKAHPDVFNLMLQVIEDGMLTDSQGRQVSFKNAVLIMTSNIGARLITEKKEMGFASDPQKSRNKEVKNEIMKELKKTFKPEFLNRIDDIIIFEKLSPAEMREVARTMLNDVSVRLQKMHIVIRFTEEAVNAIAGEAADSDYGARPLRRSVQRLVEDQIAGQMLEGDLKAGDSLLCDWQGGEMVVVSV